MTAALDDFARMCLGKLLDAGERADAGVRKRAAGAKSFARKDGEGRAGTIFACVAVAQSGS